uniref:Uncharacterized protein n=1 Tax=Setaria italica TaxID=4555 RepID=K3ZYE6_SETIT
MSVTLALEVGVYAGCPGGSMRVGLCGGCPLAGFLQVGEHVARPAPLGFVMDGEATSSRTGPEGLAEAEVEEILEQSRWIYSFILFWDQRVVGTWKR